MKQPEEFLKRGKGNFINCTDYDDAIQAMKDYASQSKWISVKERKPEIGHDEEFPFASKMILLSDGEFVYYGQYEKSEIATRFVDSNGDDFEDDGIEIKFWQPLPSPPSLTD